MRYAYPCNIALDIEEKEATGREAYMATFRDVPEAITGGWSRDEALEMAEDGLGVALGMYVSAREDIPNPSSLAGGEILVAVPPVIAAKLALYKAMREQGITNVALADRLGLSEGAVRRLINPEHRSHIGQVERALRAVGHTLVVEDIVAA